MLRRSLPKIISRSYSQDQVLFRSNGAVREITLNRPKQLNAINENMVNLILPRLAEYQKSETAGLILLKGAGPKGLSAGGDIKYLAELAKNEGVEACGENGSRYFHTEFALNHLSGTYSKPYVSLMDGIVMGGGVGASAHGSHRIGTERTRIAMPETKIGYYPDVGGLWFLGRLDGHLGEYLALTSESIYGWTAYLEGLTSHYIPSEKIEQVEQRLTELVPGENYFSLVASAIEEFAEMPLEPKLQFTVEERQMIDKVFAGDSVEAILAGLDEAGTDFAKKTAETIKSRAPTSLKVALSALRRFRELDFKSAFEVEANLSTNFCYNPDFAEGVTALLVEKRAPNWEPSTLDAVDNARVSSFFEPRPDTDVSPIPFTSDETFVQYPHKYGLPSEEDIKAFVTGETSSLETKATMDDVVKHFKRKCPKVGLEERIQWVLARKTSRDPDFPELLDWHY